MTDNCSLVYISKVAFHRWTGHSFALFPVIWIGSAIKLVWQAGLTDGWNLFLQFPWFGPSVLKPILQERERKSELLTKFGQFQKKSTQHTEPIMIFFLTAKRHSNCLVNCTINIIETSHHLKKIPWLHTFRRLLKKNRWFRKIAMTSYTSSCKVTLHTC